MSPVPLVAVPEKISQMALVMQPPAVYVIVLLMMAGAFLF
jgi:hypothetical protein